MILARCSLGRAPAILESRSLTTLTPLYNEDVIYALGDLVSTHGVYQGEGKTLSLLGFLKGVYASDFDNFRERVFQLAKRHAESPDTPHIKGLRSLLKHGWQAIGDDDFAPGRPLHTWALELQLWASMRAQVGGGKDRAGWKRGQWVAGGAADVWAAGKGIHEGGGGPQRMRQWEGGLRWGQIAKMCRQERRVPTACYPVLSRPPFTAAHSSPRSLRALPVA